MFAGFSGHGNSQYNSSTWKKGKKKKNIHHKFWQFIEYWKVFLQKSLEATLLFLDFSKAFDSIHRGKMEQILLVYSLPKETVAALMMLYKNTKVRVFSPDKDRLLWYCHRWAARGHINPIPVYYLSRLYDLNVRFKERKWLYTGKGKKQKIPWTNNYGCELHWWHSTSGKYTCSGWIPAA